MQPNEPVFFVFDVESVGLHGEALAALLTAARDAGYEARGQLAALRIEHAAHAALVGVQAARIAVLEKEQRRDLADVERFRTMARGYMDERDEARDFLAREGYVPCTSAACNCGAWHRATP